MTVFREEVFETNSSSSHTLAIRSGWEGDDFRGNIERNTRIHLDLSKCIPVGSERGDEVGKLKLIVAMTADIIKSLFSEEWSFTNSLKEYIPEEKKGLYDNVTCAQDVVEKCEQLRWIKEVVKDKTGSDLLYEGQYDERFPYIRRTWEDDRFSTLERFFSKDANEENEESLVRMFFIERDFKDVVREVIFDDNIYIENKTKEY